PPSVRAAVTYHSICVGLFGTASPLIEILTLKFALPPDGTSTWLIGAPPASVKLTESPPADCEPCSNSVDRRRRPLRCEYLRSSLFEFWSCCQSRQRSAR